MLSCRYKATSDATKAMQQLDNMDIAGNQISVTIAPLSQAEAAAAAAAAASALDLDDAEGGLLWPCSVEPAWQRKPQTTRPYLDRQHLEE